MPKVIYANWPPSSSSNGCINSSPISLFYVLKDGNFTQGHEHIWRRRKTSKALSNSQGPSEKSNGSRGSIPGWPKPREMGSRAESVHRALPWPQPGTGHGKEVCITELWEHELWVKETWLKSGFSTYWQRDLVSSSFTPSISVTCKYSTHLIQRSLVVYQRYSSCASSLTAGTQLPSIWVGPWELIDQWPVQAEGIRVPTKPRWWVSKPRWMPVPTWHPLSCWPWRPQVEDGDFTAQSEAGSLCHHLEGAT